MSRPSWVLLLVPLTACAPKEAAPPAPPAVDSAAVRTAVAGVWQSWTEGLKAANPDALAGLIAEDGRLDLMGSPAMVGPAQVREMVAGAFAANTYLDLAVSPSVTIPVSNDLAHEAGVFTERYQVKGKPGTQTEYGRYIAALVRGPDGTWRIGYLMGFADSTTTAK